MNVPKKPDEKGSCPHMGMIIVHAFSELIPFIQEAGDIVSVAVE